MGAKRAVGDGIDGAVGVEHARGDRSRSRAENAGARVSRESAIGALLALEVPGSGPMEFVRREAEAILATVECELGDAVFLTEEERRLLLVAGAQWLDEYATLADDRILSEACDKLREKGE